MGALRDLIRRYPVAAIAVVVAAAALGGWSIYQSRLAQQAVAPVSQAPPPKATAPSATPPPSTPTTPAGAGATAPSAPSAGQASSPPRPAQGRPNPFQPLATPSGSTPAPSGAAIPPVPPLPPGGSSGQSGPAQAAAPAAPPYRLAGLVWNDAAALAILEDGPQSYIVRPGDRVIPGTAVVAIDVRREVLRLARGGTLLELKLADVRRSP